uniref:Uncharacterized protein n=1 Tax=Aegilops tauschii subsp. strangulata TaxID=200361 RepID=A0A453KJC9_AEGTS
REQSTSSDTSTAAQQNYTGIRITFLPPPSSLRHPIPPLTRASVLSSRSSSNGDHHLLSSGPTRPPPPMLPEPRICLDP